VASGGAREGMQGKSYSNRTDLNMNPQKTAPPAPPAPPAAAGPQAMPAGAPGQATPGSNGSLFRDSANPNEPVTSGLPIGAGPGPPGGVSPGGDSLGVLRAVYQRFPSEGIRLLIEYAETHGTT
jgi:hypothetical protein